MNGEELTNNLDFSLNYTNFAVENGKRLFYIQTIFCLSRQMCDEGWHRWDTSRSMGSCARREMQDSGYWNRYWTYSNDDGSEISSGRDCRRGHFLGSMCSGKGKC